MAGSDPAQLPASPSPAMPAAPLPESPPLPLRQWTVRAGVAALVLAGLLMAMKLTVPCATSLAAETAGLLVLGAGVTAATGLGCRAVWRALAGRRP